MLAYDGVTCRAAEESVPALVPKSHYWMGSSATAVRRLWNNVAFVVADEAHREKTCASVRRLVALRALTRPDRIIDLTENQQEKVPKSAAGTEHKLAVDIQTCYSRILWPSPTGLPSSSVKLGHSAIDTPSALDRSGAGRVQIVRVLRDIEKLCLSSRPAIYGTMATEGPQSRAHQP